MSAEERFAISLPRDEKRMDGHSFRISAIQEARVTITDGLRAAVYKPLRGGPLDMRNVRVKPAYIERGAFCEAKVVTLTDGEHNAIYAPIGKP